MSANFDAVLSNLAAFHCSSDGLHAELVYFTPRGGSEREIYAVVDRDPPESIGADGLVHKPKATFVVQNHASAGLLVTEIEGGKLRYNKMKGNDDTEVRNQTTKPAREANNTDAGSIRVEV